MTLEEFDLASLVLIDQPLAKDLHTLIGSADAFDAASLTARTPPSLTALWSADTLAGVFAAFNENMRDASARLERKRRIDRARALEDDLRRTLAAYRADRMKRPAVERAIAACAAHYSDGI